MPYYINKYNGTTLATVQDGTVNSSLDIKLIGKNFAGFGETFNENLVWLLENFAGTASPGKPITGQLWYDTLNKQLKVFSGSEFKSTAGLEISEVPPSNPSAGQLWFNSATQQLFVYSSLESKFVLIGPQRSLGKGETSATAGLLSDGTSTYAVIKVSVDDTVIAYISNSEFVPVSSTDYSIDVVAFPTIKRGITVRGASSQGVTTDVTMWGTASNALSLAGVPASGYAKTNDAAFSETVSFSDNGLTVGDSDDLLIAVEDNAGVIRSVTPLMPIRLQTKLSNGDILTNLQVSDNLISPAISRVVDVGTPTLKFKDVYAVNFNGTASQSSKLFVTDGVLGINDYSPASVASAAYTIAARDAAGDITANSFKGVATSAMGLRVNQVTIPASNFIQTTSPIFNDLTTPVTLSDIGLQFGSPAKFSVAVDAGKLLFSTATHTPFALLAGDILPGNPVTGLEPSDPEYRNNIGSNSNRFSRIFAKEVTAVQFNGNLVGGKADVAVLAETSAVAAGLKTYSGSVSDENNVIGNFSPPGNTQNVIDTVPVRVSSDLGPAIFTNVVGNASTVTDGVYISTPQTITGAKTFTAPVIGSAGFVGNLTGSVDASTITASGVITTSSGFVGNLTGTATSANSAANVTNPAQPIITSLGVLTGLTLEAGAAILPTVDLTCTIGSSNRRFTSIFGDLVGNASTASSAAFATIAGEVENQANSATIRAETTLINNTIVLRDVNGDFSANIMRGTATQARYADLAEKYLTDQDYPAGTVVAVGGAKEVTAAHNGDFAIGVISTNPAYMMNSELEGGQYVALKGRVPVRVCGPVQKGDKLVPGINGLAKACRHNDGHVFGVSLTTDLGSGERLVEAFIR